MEVQKLEKKKGDIEDLLDSINSALKEQKEIIDTSFNIFDHVLSCSNAIDKEDFEKVGYRSSIASILSNALDIIVANNNKLIELNNKRDL